MEGKEILKSSFCLKSIILGIVVFVVFIGGAVLINSLNLKCSENNNYQDSPVIGTIAPETKIDSVAPKENEEEQRRKEIFAVEGKSYKRVVEIVMEKYPYDLKKQSICEEQLVKQYQKKIMKHYGITKKELDAIILEGGEKRWEWE